VQPPAVRIGKMDDAQRRPQDPVRGQRDIGQRLLERGSLDDDVHDFALGADQLVELLRDCWRGAAESACVTTRRIPPCRIRRGIRAGTGGIQLMIAFRRQGINILNVAS